MSETEFSLKTLSKLEPYFDIYQEVSGKHFSGHRLRIDAVVVPKDKNNWKNPNVALGIEFKDDMRLKNDMHNYTGWLAQCVDYANTNWDNFGYLYVFACPGIFESMYDTVKAGNVEWLFSRVMSQLGVGELRYSQYYGLTFFVQHSHRIWSEENGLERGKDWTLTRKFGSR